jgi:hypothetical protein
VIIDDVMKRNDEFMKKAYQRSFLYFCRYLSSKSNRYQKVFKTITDSKLSAIGGMTIVHQAKKRDTLYLPYGGFLVKGDIYFKEIDRDGEVIKTKHHNLSLIMPT